MMTLYGKEEQLARLFEGHPHTKLLLELCRDENPTTQAFGALNTMQTIKRTDSTVTDALIAEWLQKLNEPDQAL